MTLRRQLKRLEEGLRDVSETNPMQGRLVTSLTALDGPQDEPGGHETQGYPPSGLEWPPGTLYGSAGR
jgi:hypothetical protein